MRAAPFFVLAALACSCAKGPDRSDAPAPAPPGATAAVDGKGGPRAATATQIQPLDQKKFGAAITEPMSTPLNKLVAEPGKFASQTVRTEGTVVAVCKSMGCWMEIADDTGKAHIKMAGHSFFVPRTSNGHRAIVQGKVQNAVSDECSAKDGCRENAANETGQVAKVEIEATGIEFVD